MPFINRSRTYLKFECQMNIAVLFHTRDIHCRDRCVELWQEQTTISADQEQNIVTAR